jgi:hypothetical protein
MARKQIIKYLIILSLLAILLVIMFNMWNNYKQNVMVKVIRYGSQLKETDEYIITEKMVLSSLKMKSQIVSLEEELHKKQTMVDSSLFGERKTRIVVDGNFKMGLNTEDIKVIGFDSKELSVTLDLPEPVIISLEIPFDKISFSKEQGFWRASMNDEEEKDFYKTTKTIIEKELMKDKDLLKQANLCNQEVIRELIVSVGIQHVYFK